MFHIKKRKEHKVRSLLMLPCSRHVLCYNTERSNSIACLCQNAINASFQMPDIKNRDEFPYGKIYGMSEVFPIYRCL